MMAGEMVERVAAAIWAAHTGSSDFHEDTFRHDEKEREWWRSVARAAIEAMRVPTDEMDLAGVHAEKFRSLGLLKVHGIWGSMIDTALKD